MTKAAELAKMGEVLTNSQIGGRRNLIINGAMQVAQRGTSFTSQNAVAYHLDRWETSGFNMGDGVYRVDQSTDAPADFMNSTKIACTTADTSQDANNQMYFQQQIEGLNCSHVNFFVSNADTITLSFHVKSNRTGTYSFALKLSDNASVENNTSTRIYNTTYTISVANTFEKKTITIPLDTNGSTKVTNNTFSMAIQFWLGAGSNRDGAGAGAWGANGNAATASANLDILGSTDNNWYITGVQMELGSQATPFEHRSFGEELALCQRYYYRVQSSAEANIAAGNAWDARSSDYSIRLPTTMRAAYTLGVSALTDILYKYGARSERSDGQYFRLINSTALDIASINHQILTNVTTVGFATHLALKDDDSFFDFDAEL